MLMVVGLTVDRTRDDEARLGRQPRNDITEFSARLGVEVIDFEWLARHDGAAWRPLTALARRTGRWSEALSIRAFFVSRRHEVVYATGEDVALPLAALCRVARWRRQRIVVRLENPAYGSNRMRQAVYSRLLRFALARMDIVLCRTTALAEQLRAKAGREPGRIRVFGQEVDTVFFDPSAAVDDDGASVVPEGRYVLSAGLEMRDYETLLAAVADLPVTVVVGAASPWSKDRFSVDEPPPNVVIGRFSSTQMRELYRRASAVVLAMLPTDRACGMNVIAEAWAMGRPVVAATSGLRDSVIEAGSRAVAPGDVGALRQAVIDVLDAGPLADEMGANGRSYVESYLSLDGFVDEVAMLSRHVA